MNKFFTLAALAALFLLSSCFVAQKVVYVDDMRLDSAYRVMPEPALKIQKGDRLSIRVSAKNAELAAPFNVEGGVYTMDEKGGVAATASNSQVNERGYLVDPSGNIDFPVLGTIKVEGYTLEGLRDMLRNALVSKKLIDAPVIKVELLNLKIMTMGELATKGILNVPDGNITLLEAIAKSGGITANAVPNEIMVIREEHGVRKMYANDITKKSIFNSPTFHLQQNDIVYVRPRGGIQSAREDNNWRYVSLFTTMLTLGITLFAIFKK